MSLKYSSTTADYLQWSEAMNLTLIPQHYSLTLFISA